MVKFFVRHWNDLSDRSRIFIKLLVVASLCCVILALFFPEKYRNMIYLVYVSIPTNSFIPIPHEPVILFYSKILSPLLVALLGAFGASISAATDYIIVSKAFRSKRMATLKENKQFSKYVSYFQKMPFITVLLFSTGIIPVFYPIRVLVPASRYPVTKYIAGIFTGRLIRFYVLATFGYIIKFPNWFILLIGILMFVFTVWVPVSEYIKHRARKKEKNLGQDESETNVPDVEVEA